MREHWTYKTFGEVGSFLRGKSIQKADYVEKGMPCIHYGQIHTKFGISTDKHLSEIPLELYNRSIIASPGDVIIAITSEDLDGSCKSTAWLGNYDVAVSAHAAVYKHNLNPKFIAYYLRSNSFYVEKKKYARGFKVMEIKPTDIARIPLPIPPSDIQQDIVAELDKVNDMMALKRKQLDDLNILAQSLFYEMFGDPVVNEKGWEVKKLGDICTKISDGVHAKPIYTEKGIPFVSVININKGYLDLSASKYVSVDDGITMNKRTKPEKGDVLYTKVGATYGIPALVDTDTTFCLYVSVCLIKPNRDVIDSVFLKNLMALPYIKNQADDRIRGIGVPDLHLNQIAAFTVPLPPLPIQQSFATKIAKIEAEKQRVKSSLKDLETLLASRMQYWFDN